MKKMAILALLFMSCMNMYAQEIVSQENVQKAKNINEVKLSEEAMYAEVIQLATDDFEAVSLAQQKTISKLQNNVVEACARQMKLTKEQAQEIFDVIDDKCQNVVIEKGDMVRVFAYIAKDAVGLSRKKLRQEDIDEVFGTEGHDSIAIQKNIETATSMTVAKNDSVNNVSEKINESAQQAVQTVQQITQQALGQNVSSASQTVVVVQQPTQNSTTVQAGQTIVVVQQPVSSITTVTPVSEPKVEPKPLPVVEVAVPVLCQNIIAKGNYDNVRRFLDQEKTYHKLMYGTIRSMQRPEKCYIVLIDKATDTIVAVLDKGESERMNFVSKQMDHFRNYQGGNYRAILVQEL